MKPTRAEILAEPAGRQLDAWVAEYVMGWRWIRFESQWPPAEKAYVRRAYPADSVDVRIGKPAYGDEPLAFLWDYNLPHYSTDIAAAWQVVERLRLCITPQDSSSGGYVVANRHDWNEPGLIYTLDREVQLAICRAALLAVIEGGE